MNFVSNR